MPRLPLWFYQGFILVVGCLAYALTFFHRYAPSVLYKQIAETLNVSTDAMGTFGSMYFWPYAVMQPVGGILCDVFSPGRLIAAATLLSSLGALVCALSTNFGLSSFARFLVGVGAGPIFVPASRLIASWFTNRGFVIASGILLSAGAAGGLVAQGPLASAVENVQWQWAFYGACIFGCVIAVLSFFMKTTPQDAGIDINHGLSTDLLSESEVELVHKPTVKDMFLQLWENIKIVVTNKQFWLVVIWGVCSPSCFFNLSSLWAGPYLRDVCHLSDHDANMYIMMLSLAWIIGSPAFMVLTEVLKTRKWMLFCAAFITSMTSICFLFVDHETPVPLLLTLLFIFALFSSSIIGVENSMYKEMHIDSVGGTGMGCGNFFPFITAGFLQLLSPLLLKAIDGRSKDHTFEAYRYGIWLVNVILTLIAMIGVGLARDTYNLPLEQKAGYAEPTKYII